MPRGDTDGVYGGAAGRTRSEAIHWSCPCGAVVSVEVVRVVDTARDPDLAEKAREDKLHRVSCSACTAMSAVELPFVYHDGAARRLLLVLPSTLRHRELDERAALMLELARDRGHDVPRYARDFGVVFGADGLRAELARAAAASVAAAKAAATPTPRLAPGGAPVGGAAVATAAPADLELQKAALATRSAVLDGRTAALEAREAELIRRTVQLEAREGELSRRASGTPRPTLVVDDPDEADAEPGRTGSGPYENLEDDDLTEGSGAHLMPGSSSAPKGHVTRKTVGSRDLAVERWIVSREPARAVVEQGRVRLFAVAPATRLEDLVQGQLVPRLQLFRTSTYPVAVLSVRLFSGPPDDDAPVSVLLDPQRIDDRSVLGVLALGFRVELELYDAEHLPVVQRTVGAPLEDNVRAVISAAEAHLQGLPLAQRSFAAACAELRSPGFDRHGRRAHSLEEDSFSQLPSAAVTQVALTVVGFWSEAENQEYLLLERAFPSPWWRRIRSRVVQRAADLGLALPASLAQVAISEGLARSRKDLAGKLARAFADTCAHEHDLDDTQRQDNWRAIVAECEALGVSLEGSAADLAAQAVGAPPAPARKEMTTDVKNREVAVARRAMSSPVIAGEIGGTAPARRDLGKASLIELVDLLEDKDVRRDAAIELSRRADLQAVGPVFGAVRRMTRGEAVRVLPHVVSFGERAVPHLLDGLRSRKGFLRHGCALALGVVKSGDGIEPLCELLLAEPTEVWREVARAVGELGAGAVMSLAARLRDAPADRRERISWALAHVVARGGRGPVETLAAGRDALAAGAAQRALEMADVARDNDEEVRGAAPARDQTVNRAFSRRFFEAMAQNGDSTAGVELSADDAEIIEEDEELLDEEDLIPG